MNKFKWAGDPSIKGWLNTEAIKLVGCPKCKSSAGYYCETPKGLKTKSPHTERLVAFNSSSN